MSTVSIVYNIKEEPARENIERELVWYDIIKKESKVFHGGELIFKYKKDDYLVKMGETERSRRGIKSTFRLLPEVKDLKVVNCNKINKESNKTEVEKWFDSYLNYNNTDIEIENKTATGIDFEVPEKEMDDFLYQIERSGFRYIYD